MAMLGIILINILSQDYKLIVLLMSWDNKIMNLWSQDNIRYKDNGLKKCKRDKLIIASISMEYSLGKLTKVSKNALSLNGVKKIPGAVPLPESAPKHKTWMEIKSNDFFSLLRLKTEYNPDIPSMLAYIYFEIIKTFRLKGPVCETSWVLSITAILIKYWCFGTVGRVGHHPSA